MQRQFSGYGGVKVIATKPAGGFCYIRVRSFLAVWTAFRKGEISLYDVRVWLASFEIVAQRCKAKDRIPEYKLKEVLALVSSGTQSQVRTSINRLMTIGLLHWADREISLNTSQAETRLGDDDAWLELLNAVANNRRKAPVPRKMIRYLSQSRSVSLHMVTWGHMLRCMYYRKDRCVSGGRVKSSWIAQTFQGDERNIKKARKTLIEIGWLVPIESSQIAMNRWGLQAVINLHWAAPGSKAKTPPLQDQNEAKTPPLIDRKLSYSKRSINQKLEANTGVKNQTNIESIPSLKHITIEDLRDPVRLDQLYRAATKAGSLPHSEANRLLWFAAAERALAEGKHNPCGLFVSLYRRKLWHHITQEQEDRARVKLKILDYGEEPLVSRSIYSQIPDYDSLAA